MKYIFTAGLLYLSTLSFGQVGIGTAQPNNNAILDLTATNKGFLPPRLSTVQRDNIPGISEGLVIYNTDIKCLQYWNSSTWVGNCKTAPPPGIITGLDCSTAVITGTLEENTAASGVSATIAYSGGNGGIHSGQTVTSTGVTGLTATLAPGAFANGNGMLTYIITGTPVGSGTASFAINLGGQACNLTINVDSPPPPIPDLSVNCSGLYIPYKSTGETVNGMIGGKPVNIIMNHSFSKFRAVSDCGLDRTAYYGYMSKQYTSSNLTIKFDRPVSNLKIFQSAMHKEETYTYTFKKNGIIVRPALQFSSLGCPDTFIVTNTATAYKINGTLPHAAGPSGNGIYNFGGIWFDEVILESAGAYSTSIFEFCVGNIQ